MECTDTYVILILQVAIVLFTIVAIFKNSNIKKQEKASEVSAEVVRGKNSMTALYTMYGATIASCLVIIDNASGIEGHKVILIVIDFLCATYVYYFNTWFRNSIFFPLKRKVSKD